MSSSDQDKLLQRAIGMVEQQNYALKMYFDNGSDMDALHCCANLLRGMRTAELSPKAYYELYIKVTNVLNNVELQLTDDFKNGKSIPHLYEIVQYMANILPRMYLLITIGVVHIKCGELPCHEILKDLVEMCRGVQHPLRGLFLRNYLLTSIRPDLLPDSTPTVDGEGVSSSAPAATVLDSINFILVNFAEMNKLWVRMQHQGHTRDRERREQERLDLRVLVGANLHRLSQLEAVTVDIYKTHILPHVLEQVIRCHDVIAQEYLMDVLIQAFPDDFHMETLPQLLQACEHLQPAVRIKPIIGSLVERLLTHITSTVQNDSEQPEQAPVALKPSAAFLFESLSTEISQLVSHRASLYTSVPEEARAGLPPQDVPGLFAPLVAMAISLFTEGEGQPSGLVDQVLSAAAGALAKLSTAPIQGGSLLSRELVCLLHLPIYGPSGASKATNSSSSAVDSTTSVSIFNFSNTPPPNASTDAANSPNNVLGDLETLSTLLHLSGFLQLFELLDITAKRRLACALIARALERDVEVGGASQRITSEADLECFFKIIGVLIEPDSVAAESTMADEHSLLASVPHLIGQRKEGQNSDRNDVDLILLLLKRMQKEFGVGGNAVVKATFPALVFEAIQLLPVIYAASRVDSPPSSAAATETTSWETQCERAIAFCHQLATKLIASSAPEAALRVFLNSTLVIEAVPFTKQPHFAYEFFSQAFTLFEQELSDARSQFSAFCLMVSTLCQLRCLDSGDGESYRVLRTQCNRAAFNLLLRTDQSRAVAITAQLYAREDAEAEEKAGIFKCLEKSRTLADMCMDLDARAQLFVDLLNHYVKYRRFAEGDGDITEKVSTLLQETEKLIGELEFVSEALEQYFQATKKTIVSYFEIAATASTTSDAEE